MLFNQVRNKENRFVFETIIIISKSKFNKSGKRGYKPINTIDREFLINHGFTEDSENKTLSELFTKHNKFREVNISVNFIEPCMLLARRKEKNVTVDINSIQENRLILKRKRSRDKFDTVIMNILLDEIKGCLFKDYDNGLFEFEFEVRELAYSLYIEV